MVYNSGVKDYKNLKLGKKNPEWGNPDPDSWTWFVLTHKGILDVKQGKGREQNRGEENLQEIESQNGGRTEMKSKERHILMDEVIMGLARNLAL